MLQVPGDSSALTPDELARLEALMDQAAEEAGSRLRGVRGRLYVAYAGEGYARAATSTVYWPLHQLTSATVEILPVETLLYHVMAYREDTGSAILAFYEEGAEAFSARLAQAGEIMGYSVVHVTPPLTPLLREQLEREGQTTVTIDTGLSVGVSYIVFAAKLVRTLLKTLGATRVRGDRVDREYGSISPVYSSLLESYREPLNRLRETLRNQRQGAMYYTPTLDGAASLASKRAAARYHAHLASRPLSSLHSDLAAGWRPDLIAVLHTGAEDDLVRAARFEATRRGYSADRLVLLRFNTDPVTAPLYSALLLSTL